MSHFSVLVITPNGTEEEVTKALQPYHEYECTGIQDEFVVFVDHTEKVTKEYQEDGTSGYELPTGEIVSTCDDKFFRDPTAEEKKSIGPMAGSGCGHGLQWSSRDWGDGMGYRTKVLDKPNLKEVIFPHSMQYKTIEEFAKDWHGYTIEDGRIGRMANPNRKWDWWVVGGRWSDSLKEEVTHLDAIINKKEARVGDSMKIKEVDPEGLSCFALVDAKGQWHEVGEMGWFACVSDEKNKFVWKAEMFKLLAEANQEHFVTMVDCHI